MLQPFFSFTLKIDRVIVSTDTNPMYLDFWPIVAKAWTQITGIKPTLALIAPHGTPINDTIGDVIRFDPIPGISNALYSQVIRLLLPVFFENDVCLISDIDMIPLSKDYFVQTVADLPENSFVVYRDRAYEHEPYRYPMCYNAAKGKIFKEIFNVQDVNQIPSIVTQWNNLHWGWQTDEMILSLSLRKWHGFNSHCIRLGHSVTNRVDRSDWQYNINLLKAGHYIDCHSVRPYSLHKKAIDTLLEVVGITI